MAPSKRPTVYDLASLRLHSDGMLAQKRPVLSSPTPRNRVTMRDARGNWIAKDAVGRMTVNKHREKGRTLGGEEESDEESFNSTRIAGGDNTGVVVNGRANRKEKGKERDVSPQSIPSSVCSFFSFRFRSLSDITQDLLKCIHHFASNYYAERCQLSRHPVERGKSHSRETSEDVFTSSPTPDDEDTSDDESSDSDHTRSESNSPTPKDNRERNMYKIMDGSALMAIGPSSMSHFCFAMNFAFPQECYCRNMLVTCSPRNYRMGGKMTCYLWRKMTAIACQSHFWQPTMRTAMRTGTAVIVRRRNNYRS